MLIDGLSKIGKTTYADCLRVESKPKGRLFEFCKLNINMYRNSEFLFSLKCPQVSKALILTLLECKTSSQIMDQSTLSILVYTGAWHIRRCIHVANNNTLQPGAIENLLKCVDNKVGSFVQTEFERNVSEVLKGFDGLLKTLDCKAWVRIMVCKNAHELETLAKQVQMDLVLMTIENHLWKKVMEILRMTYYDNINIVDD